jgi:hypothetical protein
MKILASSKVVVRTFTFSLLLEMKG